MHVAGLSLTYESNLPVSSRASTPTARLRHPALFFPFRDLHLSFLAVDTLTLLISLSSSLIGVPVQPLSTSQSCLFYLLYSTYVQVPHLPSPVSDRFCCCSPPRFIMSLASLCILYSKRGFSAPVD